MDSRTEQSQATSSVLILSFGTTLRNLIVMPFRTLFLESYGTFLPSLVADMITDNPSRVITAEVARKG